MQATRHHTLGIFWTLNWFLGDPFGRFWQDILQDLRELLQQREEASQHASSMEEQLAEKLHAVWWVMDCRLEVVAWLQSVNEDEYQR